MLRKILVALKWAIVALAGICVVLYLILLAVNWRDAEASPSALHLADLYRNRPPARDQENAYVYALGFDAAPGVDPLEMGLKRLAWLQRGEESDELNLDLDPLGPPFDHRSTRHPAVQAYFDDCGPRDPGCSAAFESARLAFGEWQASEAWLLQRYRTFLNLGSSREFVSRHLVAPLPSYAAVMDGQKVLLLHARIRAATGDTAGAKELLAEDLRFWRRALESSDLLISKMIATAALLRHFKLGAEIITALPSRRVQEALPAEWDVAITDAERSMWRVVTGEWVLTSGVMRDLESDMAKSLPTDDSMADKMLAYLSEPHFQPQDTINIFADQYTNAAQLIEGVPLTEYEAATSRMDELAALSTREAWPPRSLYNIPGRIIVGYGPGFGSYARRVGDIEGVRLAALAAVSLHAASVAPEDIPAALAASSYRNPYDGRPFSWDAGDGAVVFRGLEPGERGEHRIH